MFEAYVRHVLADAKNVPVSPDIVVEVDGRARLIVDAKYKTAADELDRKDVNHVAINVPFASA